MSQRFADIIVDISHEAIDRTFQYKIPEELEGQIRIGMSVSIPFGRGNNLRKGYVIGFSDTPEIDEEKLKYINDIEKKDVAIESTLIELAAFIKDNYGSTMINALKTVMPIKEKVKNRTKKEEFDTRYEEENFVPNDEQTKAIKRVVEDFERGDYKTYLLKGITGSGKTLVYIEIIEKMLQMGKQAIVLIPEIALTYQTVARFRNRFGDKVAIMNSKLSKGERYEQFERAKKGDVSVVIGPRSALFAPFSNLGLIVIDEEHEQSYKSDTTPKYHAREVAIKRASMCGASVILGSATPSIDSYYKAVNKEYELITLNERAKEGATLAKVSVVDLRKELEHGNRSIFSNHLRELIRDRLDKHEQTMLFINRRGYSGFISCRECGYVFKCPHCDVSLKEHNGKTANAKLVCHYCGYEIARPKLCPECNSKFIAGFGTGTEKVESEIKKEFPDARVLRMDADTTKRKNAHEKIVDAFAKGKADILVGTQMIVKGHDFPNVTLVGAVAADTTLFDNDYMAAEKTFDLLAQAAGRAGRSDKGGEVVIQTYKPDDYCIIAAANQDYDEFFEEELAYREMLNYPPVFNMLVLFMESEYEELMDKYAQYIRQIIDDYYHEDEEIKCIGPCEANIYKLDDNYRKVIYIKSKSIDTLISIKDRVESALEKNTNYEKCFISFDFNPLKTY